MAAASPPDTPGALSISAQFDQALGLHQQGQLAQAAALYEAILARDAVHFDALHLLGVIAAQSGDPARAVTLIDRALAIDAKQAQAHHHRALALRDQGGNAEALAGFEAVLALDPAHADAWISHAETLQAMGRDEDAVRSYGRALALQADHAQALFARGILLQHLQRHAEALDDYERALTLQPGFPGALNNRALVLRAIGRHEEALAGFDQLLALVPEHIPAHLARIQTLAALRRHAEALAACEGVLILRPDDADALLARGRMLRALGRHEEAQATFSRLTGMAPHHAEAWFEQGSALQALGRDEPAVAAFGRALAAQPELDEARANMAMALLSLKRTGEALAAIDEAVAQRPNLAEAWHNRGVILGALKRRAEAIASYDHALALRPDYASAHAGRAHELEVLRRLPEALAAYERALAIDARNPEFHYGRGAVLNLMERNAEALDCYDQALALAPDHAASLFNRGGALRLLKRPALAAAAYARLLEVAPDHPYARGNLLHAQLHTCDWSGWPDRARLLADVMAGKLADMPFHMLAVTDGAATQRQCARLHAADAYPRAAPVWRGERYQHNRIRVAYVSGDLSFHPVSYLAAALFEAHDRGRFEVHAYSLRPAANTSFDARMRGAFEHFTDVSALGDVEIARLMREHEIDIAVDLMGYTNLPRTGIYAHRGAPVHAAYLGYAGTLATGYMDYLIADAVALPSHMHRHIDEAVVQLPASFMPRDTALRIPPAPTRAAAGLPERGFVFCCFNNGYKLNPPVFDIWMRLLGQVPGSVLWLSPPGAEARENLLREARSRGVAADRIVFADKTPGIEAHLARSSLADLFLDTLPYNAHTTASDALWAGVPLVTCAGEAMASRVAASLLQAAGLPELITGDLAQYEALALRLARDPGALARMRAHLEGVRAQGSLFEVGRLRRYLEAAYLHMHERSQRGLAPEGFAVPA